MDEIEHIQNLIYNVNSTKTTIPKTKTFNLLTLKHGHSARNDTR